MRSRILLIACCIVAFVLAFTINANAKRRVIVTPEKTGQFEAQGKINIEPLPEIKDEIYSAVVAEPYSCVLTASGGKGYGYAWGHSVLPLGLVLQMDAEVAGKVYIEGIPEKEGKYEITIKATDVVDSTVGGEFTYVLTVSPNPAAVE